MTKDEALRMALEALELHGNQYPHMVKGYCLDAITAIKEAHAQPEQDWEAVAADQAMTIALLKVDEPVHRKPLTDTRVKVKLGSQYGEDLAGHWFFLQPADNFADAALAKHSGIEAAHGIKGDA